MVEPVCREPLSWDLQEDPQYQESGTGGLGGEGRERRKGGEGRGDEKSFLQQLMARQTGPVSQNTHSTLQIAPKTGGHRKALRRSYGRQRTATVVDLPTNIGFFLLLFFLFFFLNNLPNTGRCFVKKVAVQNCTENLSKNRSVVILKIKALSSDEERQILSDTSMGGISDVDLENGPVEEPEGKRSRDEKGRRTTGRVRPGRNALSQPVLLSRQPSTKQTHRGDRCRGKSALNSRYSNLQDTKPTKVHQVLKP